MDLFPHQNGEKRLKKQRQEKCEHMKTNNTDWEKGFKISSGRANPGRPPYSNGVFGSSASDC